MSAATVGIVLPLYNAARYVAAAVDSALAAAGNVPVRIVAVDDGSDDDGLAIACGRSPLVEGVRIEHAGLSARLAAFAADPAADGVFGRVEQFICPSVPAERRARLRFAASERPSPMITALLLRRRRFLDVGPFDPATGNGENLDWQLRARAKELRMIGIDALVLRRRIHGDNLSLRNLQAGRDYLRVLRAHIARGQPR